MTFLHPWSSHDPEEEMLKCKAGHGQIVNEEFLLSLAPLCLFSGPYLGAWYCIQCIGFVLVQAPTGENVRVHNERIYTVCFKKPENYELSPKNHEISVEITRAFVSMLIICLRSLHVIPYF